MERLEVGDLQARIFRIAFGALEAAEQAVEVRMRTPRNPAPALRLQFDDVHRGQTR